MENTEIPRVTTAEANRNRTERMRQNGIDDEIQKLVCFLPGRQGGTQKLSRNQILMGILEIARKMTEEETKPLKEAVTTTVKNEEPSTSG